MKILVGSAKCETYDREEVYAAVKSAIEGAGGLPPLNGKRVLLKPNLLAEATDGINRGICTHPEVVYAVGKIVLEHGGILDITDSPGGGVPNTLLGKKRLYVGCGIDKIAEELGVTLSYDLGYQHRTYPNAKKLKNFTIINAVCDADIIISICKLKTHLFTRYTGAVKNTFGVIPGTDKSALHPIFPNPSDFSEMLIDLNEMIQPAFVVMDAIVGMEGDGPSGGKPRKIGYVLASSSIYAADVIGQQLIGLNPTEIATTQAAMHRDLLSLSDIELSGDTIQPLNDYLMPSTYCNYVRNDKSNPHILHIKKYLSRCLSLASRSTPPSPYLSQEKCTFCKECLRICESNAISIKKEVISFNRRKCTHCYGCYSVCATDAIKMKPPQFTIALRKIYTPYPVVNADKCLACGQCIRICPVGAASFVNKKAAFDVSKCIRCYCCHEMCTYNAIELKDTPISKLLHTCL